MALLLVGLLPVIIAQAKHQSFLILSAYGTGLPIVALPHAILLKRPKEAAARETCS